MNLLSKPKPFRRFSLLRRPLRALPLLLLNGALVKVAQAQTGAAQTPAPSALYSLVSTLSVFAFFALLIGLFRPRTFAFLFHEKATRGRVCGAFGAVWFFLVILSGPLRPRPVATAPTQVVQSTQRSDTGANTQVRLAQNRAKAAEARAAKAEKAAALSSTQDKERAKRDRANEERVKRDLGITDSLLESQTTTAKGAPKDKDEALAENVSVVEIEGVGKREMGVVDEVAYVIGKAETAKTLGSEMMRREADGVFYVLQVAADNGSKTTHNVTTLLMKLVDDQGREFDPSSEGNLALSMAGDQSAEPFSAQLQPGVTKKLTLVYDLPDDAKGLKLHIPAGFGFGKSADIRVPGVGE